MAKNEDDFNHKTTLELLKVITRGKKTKFDWEKYGWLGFVIWLVVMGLFWYFFSDIMFAFRMMADNMYAMFITLVVIGVIVWLIYRGITRKD